MLSPSKIRVAVLRGGPSSEYDVSLKTGGSVLQNLPEKYQALDVFIDKDGLWHMHGLPKSPERILNQVDVVFNALHGQYGEDGQVQRILETHAIPFTGSTSFGSSMAMNKILSKQIFATHGLKTPHYVVVRDNDDIDMQAAHIFKTFVMPTVVKPASAGSSIGVSIVRTLKDLKEAIKKAFGFGHQVIVEDFIRGKEATCGVIENFRGQPIYVLMPTEIRPKTSKFFDYDAKYVANGSEEITPGDFSAKDKKLIEDYAKLAHTALGLRHYSRSDFIVTPKNGVYILETNTLPGLTESSLLPKALVASGSTVPHFLDHVLTLAMDSTKY